MGYISHPCKKFCCKCCSPLSVLHRITFNFSVCKMFLLKTCYMCGVKLQLKHLVFNIPPWRAFVLWLASFCTGMVIGCIWMVVFNETQDDIPLLWYICGLWLIWVACGTLTAVEVGCPVTCHGCNSRFLGGISFHECVMVGMFYNSNNGFLLCSSVFWQCSWWIWVHWSSGTSHSRCVGSWERTKWPNMMT